MNYITVKLTEDQAYEVRELVRDARVERAQYILNSPDFDKPDETLAYLKRLETTLAKQLAKN